MSGNRAGDRQIKIEIGVDTIVDALAGLGGKCLDFMREILRLRRDRRARIADYLQDIGRTIGAVATGIEKGRDISGKCGELNGHLYGLSKTAKPALGKNVAKLQADIEKAYRVEDLARALKSSNKTQRGRYVAQLRATSGTFLAMAKAVRASI